MTTVVKVATEYSSGYSVSEVMAVCVNDCTAWCHVTGHVLATCDHILQNTKYKKGNAWLRHDWRAIHNDAANH